VINLKLRPWKNNSKLIEALYNRIQDLEIEVSELKKEVDLSLSLKKVTSDMCDVILRRIKEEFSSRPNSTPVS